MNGEKIPDKIQSKLNENQEMMEKRNYLRMFAPFLKK